MITLTNGVQIPENAVQLRTTAAIDGYYVTQPLRLVQYDETLPVAAVQLTYQNQPYTPPTGAELNVRMGKPDGTTVYNPCLGMDSSGIVYFAFTQQMTIVAGTGTLTVEITGSGVKNSAPIIAEIRPNPVPEGAIASTDEFLTLQEILAEAEKWGQIVQTNASNIQQVVDNLTDIQNAAENAQAAAESAAAAQQAAQEALGFRTFFSAVTPDANGNLDPSRPMVVGPAASVEIESAGDRIQSVTALGFTTQAGTGDPSPNNVRAITNGGLRMVELVLTGKETFYLNNPWSAGNYVASYTRPEISADISRQSFCNQLQKNTSAVPQVQKGFVLEQNAIYVVLPKSELSSQDSAGIKAWLAARYAAGNPLTIWYVPADESQATGLYAPIILTSGEYRATCLPLTAPLCDGDSVVSWAKSGCDKVLVLDGTTNRVIDGGPYWFNYGAPDLLAGATVYSDYVPPKDLQATSSYIQIGKTAVAQYGATAEALNEYLAAHPLTVWYRSTNYTEAADIPVSLETHQQAVLVLDGTEAGLTFEATRNQTEPVLQIPLSTINRTIVPKCSHYNPKNAGFPMPDNTLFYVSTYFGDKIAIRDSSWGSLEDAKAYLAAQYAAGTPVTIVYQLATPITYAHEAVVLEAATGDQLTYTVTGQSGGTVSVALKPFQDGGHAATADNAQQLDGLTLAALQNLLVPVGYIFSWAPAGNGPDLSTPAKVAAYFGFGTWQAYGAGQVLVGVDSGQTEFATPGKTGGEKTNTLGVDNIPSHTHGTLIGGQGASEFADVLYSRSGAEPAAYTTTADTGWGLPNWSSAALSTTSTGGGRAHNNLQPYVVVYRWQRVA